MSDRHPVQAWGPVLLAAAVLSYALSAAASTFDDSYAQQKELFVPMRDGKRLSTDVILPRGAQGKLPTILVRTPYDKYKTEVPYDGGWYRSLVDHGYALVVQSERGREFSEGSYDNYLQGARTDGVDTADWIVKQPWSNGKIGTVGCSSSGEQEWPMASNNHPAHAAMIPLASGTAVGDVPRNDTHGAIYRGGVPMMGLWAWWYHDMATTERLVLPPDTTQEQRIRLANGFSLQPRTYFYPLKDELIDLNEQKNSIAETLNYLPSKDILRQLGGALTPFDKYLSWDGPADPRWSAVEQIGKADRPRVPAIHSSTWHDIGVGESLRLFQHLQDLDTPNQYLIIEAGPHCAMLNEAQLADLSFGDLHVGDARYHDNDHGFRSLYQAWFDHWLKGESNEVLNMPRVQLYVMGQGWVSGNRYPLESTHMTRYYLDGAADQGGRPGNGLLTTSLPAGTHDDRFTYDPASPVPTRGGGCCGELVVLDQRKVEARADVLLYSTPPLEQAVSIAGPVEVTLSVSSSAKDTDFMVKLVDVYPDGKAINLSDDAIRARYRDGFDRQVFMQPGGVYRVTLTNMVTANRFAPGHRIRIEVTSSNFPLMERNLNTGGRNNEETRWVVAQNTIHHSKRQASYITLPVIPAGSER